MTSTYTVGQKLWFVPFDEPRRGPAHYVKITKVGRKWGEYSPGRYRFDLATLNIDSGGYSPPGRLYESREVYEDKQGRADAWRELAQDIERHRRTGGTGVTVQAIAKARELLGLGGTP